MTAKKTTTKKAVTRKTPAKKTTAKKTETKTQVKAEDFYKMVQEAAYFQAERDGFASDPVTYWLGAEVEILKRLGM